MDAKRVPCPITPQRLEMLEYLFDTEPMVLDAAHLIRQQQAEIERLNKVIKKASSDVAENMVLTVKLARLNRAYEVLLKALLKIQDETDEDDQFLISDYAITKAQRIKDGNACTCHISNWDSLECPQHGLGVKEGKDTNELS